jgi:DUF1365 family protein
VVGIRASTQNGPLITAVLAGARRRLDDRALIRVAVTIPAITAKVIAAIYWQALRLWLKGMSYRRKPEAPRNAVSVVSANTRIAD